MKIMKKGLELFFMVFMTFMFFMSDFGFVFSDITRF